MNNGRLSRRTNDLPRTVYGGITANGEVRSTNGKQGAVDGGGRSVGGEWRTGEDGEAQVVEEELLGT